MAIGIVMRTIMFVSYKTNIMQYIKKQHNIILQNTTTGMIHSYFVAKLNITNYTTQIFCVKFSIFSSFLRNYHLLFFFCELLIFFELQLNLLQIKIFNLRKKLPPAAGLSIFVISCFLRIYIYQQYFVNLQLN